eukprot:jgi/Mesvir1/21492/Mv03939-RA.3
MGDHAAVVATVLRKTRSHHEAGRRESRGLARVWTDFWSQMSVPSAEAGHARSDSDAALPSKPSTNLPSSSLRIQFDAVATFPNREGKAPLPAMRDAQAAVQPAMLDSGYPSSPQALNNSFPCSEFEDADSAGAEPSLSYCTKKRATLGDDSESASYQNLLGDLRKRYRGLLRRRTNYVNLLSFVLFTAFYAGILIYQRRAFLAYDIHKSLTYLLPNDGNGGVVSEFRNATLVYDWLEGLVENVWVDPICGNGVCDVPVEEAAYSRLGCQEDCGWRVDLQKITIDLSYPFASMKDDIFLWNVCRKGMCSRVTINPAGSPNPDQAACYYLNANSFVKYQSNISATIYLPAATEWEFCLLSPSPPLPVAGTISQIPLSQDYRDCLDSNREGYLGEGPWEISLKKLFVSYPGTGTASDPSTYNVSSIGPPTSPGPSGAGSGDLVIAATPPGSVDDQVVGQSDEVHDKSNGDGHDSSTRHATRNSASINDCSWVISDKEASSGASPRFGGSVAGTVRLTEWMYDREISACERGCLTFSSCFYQCQEEQALRSAASHNIPLSRFKVSDLYEICLQRMGCHVTPERAFQGYSTSSTCIQDPSTLSILKAYVPEVDASKLVDFYRHCRDYSGWSPVSGEIISCAPGCPLSVVGNTQCDPACFVDKCEFDFADCCGEYWHADGNQHYHCPSNDSHPFQDGSQLHRFGFMVPELQQSPIVGLAYNGSNGGNGGSLDMGGISKTESYRWRMVGVTNRILGGIVIKQYRTPLEPARFGERFRWLFDFGFKEGGRVKPFGANPYFLRDSGMFHPQLVNRTREFFTREQVSDEEVPLAFFPVTHRGRDVFPVFIDMSLSQNETLALLKYLESAFFLDTATEEVEVEIVTYNGILEYFGLMVVRFRRQPGGVVAITSTIQCFSLDMYNTPGERVRAAGEVLLVLMALAGTLFEFHQVMECTSKKGIYHYLSSFSNLIDLASISLLYACIALWGRFLLKYHGPFAIWLSYQPYRLTDFETDEEQTAKALEYANGGTNMRELLEAFEEVKDISRSVEVYSFLTALNLLLMMLRFLKLTNFQPRLGIVTHTLARAMNDILHYLLVAGAVFVCFAIMAHLSFGTTLVEFSTLLDAFNTCFLMVIGEVGINQKLMVLQGLQLVMAWIFFWCVQLFPFHFFTSLSFPYLSFALLDAISSTRAVRRSLHN